MEGKSKRLKYNYSELNENFLCPSLKISSSNSGIKVQLSFCRYFEQVFTYKSILPIKLWEE